MSFQEQQLKNYFDSFLRTLNFKEASKTLHSSATLKETTKPWSLTCKRRLPYRLETHHPESFKDFQNAIKALLEINQKQNHSLDLWYLELFKLYHGAEKLAVLKALPEFQFNQETLQTAAKSWVSYLSDMLSFFEVPGVYTFYELLVQGPFKKEYSDFINASSKKEYRQDLSAFLERFFYDIYFFPENLRAAFFLELKNQDVGFWKKLSNFFIFEQKKVSEILSGATRNTTVSPEVQSLFSWIELMDPNTLHTNFLSLILMLPEARKTFSKDKLRATFFSTKLKNTFWTRYPVCNLTIWEQLLDAYGLLREEKVRVHLLDVIKNLKRLVTTLDPDEMDTLLDLKAPSSTYKLSWILAKNESIQEAFNEALEKHEQDEWKYRESKKQAEEEDGEKLPKDFNFNLNLKNYLQYSISDNLLGPFVEHSLGLISFYQKCITKSDDDWKTDHDEIGLIKWDPETGAIQYIPFPVTLPIQATGGAGEKRRFRAVAKAGDYLFLTLINPFLRKGGRWGNDNYLIRFDSQKLIWENLESFEKTYRWVELKKDIDFKSFICGGEIEAHVENGFLNIVVDSTPWHLDGDFEITKTKIASFVFPQPLYPWGWRQWMGKHSGDWEYDGYLKLFAKSIKEIIASPHVTGFYIEKSDPGYLADSLYLSTKEGSILLLLS